MKTFGELTPEQQDKALIIALENVRDEWATLCGCGGKYFRNIEDLARAYAVSALYADPYEPDVVLGVIE